MQMPLPTSSLFTQGPSQMNTVWIPLSPSLLGGHSRRGHTTVSVIVATMPSAVVRPLLPLVGARARRSCLVRAPLNIHSAIPSLVSSLACPQNGLDHERCMVDTVRAERGCSPSPSKSKWTWCLQRPSTPHQHSTSLDAPCWCSSEVLAEQWRPQL